jgi:uncharacterized protein YeaO (DUF488 family)
MNRINPESIKLCRVYTPPSDKEGMWILVDRLWPRGIKKEAIEFDLWMKEIAPSTALRQWYHREPQGNWEEFAKQYLKELEGKSTLIQQILQTAEKVPVTLFYAAKNTHQNHALIIQAILYSWPSIPEIKSITQ